VSIAGPESGARYQPGQVPEVTCSATDDISLAGPCTVSVAGPTSGLGEFTVTATATDWAGNSGEATLAYLVSATTYRIDGFAQPINDPALVPSAPMSVFKAGATIPVKFQLRNEDGTLATPSAGPLFTWGLAPGTTSGAVNEPTATVTATSGGAFRYADGWWHYNWKTSKADFGKRFVIGTQLDDGTSHTVVIGLR
jgi:hypothetical protein